jgi:iron complex outermembrane recepter protein
VGCTASAEREEQEDWMRRINNTRVTRIAGRLMATASLAVIAIGSAAAQEAAGASEAEQAAADEPGDEIVVTGFRGSLSSALNAKRDSIGVIDVIKAEDIADFPDNNLAEAIQRIPGVAISRDQGEGRNITVRGLGPLYTRVRINGIEGMSTTGGADASGGANRQRAFDFNVFASELFNSITVRKTASADIEEGSLGATVDLQTARPFDMKDDMTIAGSAAIGLNDLSNAIDPKLSGLFATKLMDGRLGILVSAAYSERGILEEGPSTVRWERGTDNGGFSNASTLPAGAQQGFAFFHPRIPRYDSYSYKTSRLGLTGSIQFEPTDATLISFDALYADFKSKRSEQYLEALSFSRSGTGKPQTIILPGAQVDETNSLISGRFNNVDVRVESRYDELQTEFQQYTLSLDQDFGDRLRLTALGGYSKSEFSNPIQTTVTLDANNVQGYSFDFTNMKKPAFGYGSLDVTNPNSFALSEIRLRPQYVDNDFKVARAQLEYDVSDTFKVRAGGDWKEYGFSSQEYRRASETVVPTVSPGQLGSLTTLYSMRPGATPSGTPSTFIIPIINAFQDAFGIYSNQGTFALTGIDNNSAQGNWVTIDERDIGAFLQGVYDGEVAGLPVKADFGLRYVETKQDSSGYTGGAANPQLITASRTYDDWLPSANISVSATDDLVIRASVAKVMARPNLIFLSPGGAFSISGGNRTLNRGNPDVDANRAWSYDFAAEWYFAPEAALSVALFYKDISSFVSNTTDQIPFNELGLPAELLNGTTVQPTDLFTVTQPVNSDGGTLKGVEVGFQTPFRFLPGFLSNLGIQANYTYVKSDINYPLSTVPGVGVTVQPLLGLSQHAANATLYYQDSRFMIRASVSYRSESLNTVPGRNGVSPGTPPNINPNAGQPTFNDVEGTHGSINFDMSATLDVTENFALTFEGINLTDEYTNQYIDSAADRLSVSHHTGRQFYFGTRFKF